MKTTVYLIRHGAYENPKQIFHGRLPGFPLSEEGTIQAERVAKNLANTPLHGIYSSRLSRAYGTAKIIAAYHHVPVRCDRRLLEIRTPLQGKPLAYVRKLEGSFYLPRFISQGAETMENVFARINAFLQNKVKQHAGKQIVVVSHGDPIMLYYYRYSQKPWPKFGYSFNNWYVPMATGFTLVFDASSKLLSMVKFP